MINNEWKKLPSMGTYQWVLTVSELEKYLKHNNLPKTGKKTDKVKCIIFHVSRSVQTLVAARQRPVANPDNDGSSSDDSGEEVA